MYAHSMGGLVATGYATDASRPQPDLLVLSSPGLDAAQAAWKKKLAATLQGIVPRMKIANGLAENGLSRDPAVKTKADADPLCLNSSTVRFGAAAFAEQDRLHVLLPGLSSMPMPTYVLHGSDDPIVPLATTDVFDTKGNATRRVWPGLRHECHHEPEHEQVLAEVVAWIRSQVPGAPAA